MGEIEISLPYFYYAEKEEILKMYWNGKSNGIHTQQFLNIVHEAMKIKYLTKKQVSDSTSQAYKLQIFFQDLKSVAQGGHSNFFDEEILDTILYSIQMYGSVMGSNFKAKNLFSGRGGSRFERELTSIYEAVWNSIGEDQFDISRVLVGDRLGNISFEGVNNLAEEIVQTFGMQTYRVIEDKVKGSKLKQYYLPAVDGKSDVMGYEINIRANANPQMIEIYNLLKDCTFSAKNYDSMTWDEKAKDFIQSSGHSALILGKSNIFRAIYGTLSDLNYDDRTIKSAIFAGYNCIAKGQTDVATHFYHMRYIYELIGSGIKYNGMSFGTVIYLIYNDPHGNIYVKSTAEILSDLLEEVLDIDKKWDSTISISKNKFY